MSENNSTFQRMLEFVDKEGNILNWDQIPWAKKQVNLLAAYFILASIFTTFLLGAGIFLYLPFIFNNAGVLLALVIAFIAFIFQLFATLRDFAMPISQDDKVQKALKWNYLKLMGKPIAKEKPILFKAVILLKISSNDIALLELHKNYPKVITEENVLAKLCGVNADN